MNEIKKILTVKQKLGFFLLTVLMILNAFFEFTLVKQDTTQ